MLCYHQQQKWQQHLLRQLLQQLRQQLPHQVRLPLTLPVASTTLPTVMLVRHTLMALHMRIEHVPTQERIFLHKRCHGASYVQDIIIEAVVC